MCPTARQAEVAFDVLTASVSTADIITDVLVLYEFWEGGHTGFFAASALIFAFGQLSYAFMFAASFAPPKPTGQAAAFLAVLPLAQLVPLFAWVESLQPRRLGTAMRAVGLVPTVPAAAAADSATGGDDELWAAIHRKYHACVPLCPPASSDGGRSQPCRQAHRCPLAAGTPGSCWRRWWRRSRRGCCRCQMLQRPAFIPARTRSQPGGVLQTVFVVADGELTVINGLSLALSLVPNHHRCCARVCCRSRHVC